MTRKRSGIPLIAELAKVSIGTVDRALHGRPGISADTQRRVLRIARQIGYTPNAAARSLSTGKTIRIGICVPRELAFFYDELWAGMRDEMSRYSSRGVEFVEGDVPELGKNEDRAFKRMLSSGVSGMIVTPGDPQRSSELIDSAEADGIRVVCVSTDAPRSKRSSVVNVDPRLNGAIAGELMSNFIPGGKAAILTGMLQTVDHREKAEGFRRFFESRGGQVIATIEAHEHPEESFRKTSALLRSTPQLDGIYVNTVNCLPVCRALLALHRRQVRLIATDLFQEMIPFVKSGTIAASIHQQPFVQGQLAVRSLAEHLMHDAPLPRAQHLNPGVILQSNVHLFREGQSTRNGSIRRHARRSGTADAGKQ
jgi:LacI family transcriptional regulator